MIYNKRLTNINELTVKTYHKIQNNLIGFITLQNVYIQQINEDTVIARIGEKDEYMEYPKQQILNYINYLSYSDG